MKWISKQDCAEFAGKKIAAMKEIASDPLRSNRERAQRNAVSGTDKTFDNVVDVCRVMLPTLRLE